jgi:hypothetical protein
MMKRLYLISILSIITVCLSGCVINAHYLQEGVQKRNPTTDGDIQIYSTDSIEGAADLEPIASIASWGQGDSAAVLPDFKKKAASLGANAIIGVHVYKLNSVAQATGISGTAVFVTKKSR